MLQVTIILLPPAIALQVYTETIMLQQTHIRLDQIKCSAIRAIALLLLLEISKTFSTFFITHKLVRVTATAPLLQFL